MSGARRRARRRLLREVEASLLAPSVIFALYLLGAVLALCILSDLGVL